MMTKIPTTSVGKNFIFDDDQLDTANGFNFLG